MDITLDLDGINRTSEQTQEPNLVAYQNLRDILLKQIAVHKAEEEQHKSLLQKLHLSDYELSHATQNIVTELASLQEDHQLKKCDVESIGLSIADSMSKKNYYLGKVKEYNKVYDKLNEKITKDIKFARRELEHANQQCTVLTPDIEGLKKLQLKVDKLAKDLAKFENKHAWLSEPKYNLQHVSKEMETLIKLQNDRDKLMSELDVYQGLSPDVNEAMKQLEEVKFKYTSLYKFT